MSRDTARHVTYHVTSHMVGFITEEASPGPWDEWNFVNGKKNGRKLIILELTCTVLYDIITLHSDFWHVCWTCWTSFLVIYSIIPALKHIWVHVWHVFLSDLCCVHSLSVLRELVSKQQQLQHHQLQVRWRHTVRYGNFTRFIKIRSFISADKIVCDQAWIAFGIFSASCIMKKCEENVNCENGVRNSALTDIILEN